jgi:hypothetical protein
MLPPMLPPATASPIDNGCSHPGLSLTITIHLGIGTLVFSSLGSARIVRSLGSHDRSGHPSIVVFICHVCSGEDDLHAPNK